MHAAASSLLDWRDRTQPDVLCLQETPCGPGDLSEEMRGRAMWKRPAGAQR